MAKRFTDTERWERPWFRKLPKSYRWFWLYILDKCDPAGIWYVDIELASFMVGEKLDHETALNFFSKQIEALDDGRWFVLDFVKFQYSCLSEDCKPHQKIITSLKALNLLQRVPHRVSNTLSDRVQDKDIESLKSLKSLKTLATKDPSFNSFWEVYPKKVGKGAAEKAWLKVDTTLLPKILESVENQKKSDAWLKDRGQFIPHPATWLNQRRWEDDVKPHFEKPVASQQQWNQAHLMEQEIIERERERLEELRKTKELTDILKT